MEKLLGHELLTGYLIPWGSRLLLAVLILLLGRWAIKLLLKAVERLMRKAQVDPILTTFAHNLAYALLMAVVIIAALDQLGIHTTSLLAVLGAAGLAVGLALKDSLGNFAAGVMLILFRPFKNGDFIEAAGVSGVVEEIRIFSCRLRSGDNRTLIIPNTKIYSGTIVNFSDRETRRIDLVVGIGYDDDIRTAKSVAEKILQADTRILTDPAPMITVADLADSSINLNIRPWVENKDYWPVRSDLLMNIKQAFDDNNLHIPYPQRDVHLIQTTEPTLK